MIALNLDNDIMPFVYARLDELDTTDSESAFISSDLNKDLRKIAESVIEASATFVILASPNTFLEGREIKNNVSVSYEHVGNNYISSLKKAVIPLPDFFLRLVSVKALGWIRPVTTAITEDSASYARLQNTYLTGNMDNPKAALAHNANGGYNLELYTTDTPLEHLYVAVKPVLSGEVILMPQRLVTPFLYKVTAEVFRSVNALQRASVMEQQAIQFLNLTPESVREKPIQAETILNNNIQ